MMAWRKGVFYCTEGTSLKKTEDTILLQEKKKKTKHSTPEGKRAER